jgi:ubiquitin thioesterase protein OTUB1
MSFFDHQAQQEAIQAELEQAPILSPVLSLDGLDTEYAENLPFLQKLPVSCRQYLKHHYSGYRKTRGDGNCFYRSYLFAILEQLAL